MNDIIDSSNSNPLDISRINDFIGELTFVERLITCHDEIICLINDDNCPDINRNLIDQEFLKFALYKVLMRPKELFSQTVCSLLQRQYEYAVNDAFENLSENRQSSFASDRLMINYVRHLRNAFCNDKIRDGMIEGVLYFKISNESGKDSCDFLISYFNLVRIIYLILKLEMEFFVKYKNMC